MRLIDADALLEALTEHFNTGRYNNHTVLGYIDAAPTIQSELECSICNDSGYYCIGYSGLESDGNAPMLERCDCEIGQPTKTILREGWVSVPIEPTYEMLKAVDVLVGKENRDGGCYIDESESIDVYKAMIQAAPTDTE